MKADQMTRAAPVLCLFTFVLSTSAWGDRPTQPEVLTNPEVNEALHADVSAPLREMASPPRADAARRVIPIRRPKLHQIANAAAVPSPAVARDAESSFLEAIEIARRQRAKSFELRAATSLSRLRADQGKLAEARALLSDIYGWFTEGFDTADLREAKLLLEELETRAGASRAGQTTRSLPAAAKEGP